MTSQRTRPSLVGGAARGAVAGLAATWVMDLVTTGMLEGQSWRGFVSHLVLGMSTDTVLDLLGG